MQFISKKKWHVDFIYMPLITLNNRTRLALRFRTALGLGTSFQFCTPVRAEFIDGGAINSLRFLACVVDGCLCLNGGILILQDRRTILAQGTFILNNAGLR